MNLVKKTLYVVTIWPIERFISLSKHLYRNSTVMGYSLKRNMSRSKLHKPPIDTEMTSAEIKKHDDWWSTLSEEEKARIWSDHDEELFDTARNAEHEGQGIWSLTESMENRKKALASLGYSYHIWLAVLAGFGFFMGYMTLLHSPAPLFYLSSLCFIAFIAPTITDLRVTRAQLLYGRKITKREFFTPLPSSPLEKS